MEYRKAVDREQAARRCLEHLTLIEMLLSDRREAAADFMRLHARCSKRKCRGGSGGPASAQLKVLAASLARGRPVAARGPTLAHRSKRHRHRLRQPS
jgi:hypothetical protein